MQEPLTQKQEVGGCKDVMSIRTDFYRLYQHYNNFFILFISSSAFFTDPS